MQQCVDGQVFHQVIHTCKRKSSTVSSLKGTEFNKGTDQEMTAY